MGSQRRGTVSKDAQKAVGTSRKSGMKVQVTPKMAEAKHKADASEEELRQQVRKTLLEAATSGKLESIFPKALHSKGNSAEGATSTDKSPVTGASNLENEKFPRVEADDHSCEKVSESSAVKGELAHAATLNETGTKSSIVADAAQEQEAQVDLETLRRQARNTFCKAILSGRLDKVLGHVPGASTASASSGADIRDEVRATLENASRNGQLNAVLAQHRAAHQRQQGSPCARSSQSRRDRPVEKVEDTRDIDQLLLELGETETGKAVKGKKKAKKAPNAQDATVSGRMSEAVQQSAATLRSSEGKPLVQDVQESHVDQPEDLPAASASISPQGQSTGVVNRDGCQLLEGWHMVAPKVSRRPMSSSDHSDTSDSWSQLVPPSAAMEPICRKAPTTPASLALHRPSLGETPPKCEACAVKASKRHALPPPPIGFPPPPPASESQVTEPVSSSKGTNCFRDQVCAHGGLTEADAMRSIQIWPDTPESTPPVSPRNYCDDHSEVLVPIPIHLLAEVQRLLMAGGQQSAVTPKVAFGAFDEVTA